MKGLFDKYSLPLGIVTFLLWFFAMTMYGKGASNSDPLNSLTFGLRWIGTIIFTVALYHHFLPKLLEKSKSEERRRKASLESYINGEVKKRLQKIRHEEWVREEKERRIEEQKKAKEIARLERERIWREEYEKKLEEELRLNRSANDAAEKASSDFI